MRYSLGRLAAGIPTLLFVVTVVFLVLHVLPGDPAAILLGGAPTTPGVVARLRHQLGLDKPLISQYWLYLHALVRGNLGTSYATGEPVTQMIGTALPSTLALGGSAMVLSLFFGTLFGMLSALRSGTWIDGLIRTVSQIGISIPAFWSGVMLVLVFSVHLRWLPSVGAAGFPGLILPAITLSLAGVALLTRVVRTSVLEIMTKPFVLQLHAKGLRPAKIFMVHVLRNGLLSILTVVGLLVADVLAGTIIIETIFSRPGIGSLLVTSIISKDIPVAQGAILVIAVAYIALNILIDLTHPLIDPRVRVRLRSDQNR